MSTLNPNVVARAIITRMTEGLSTVEARNRAYGYHDNLCMRHDLMSPVYQEMKGQFSDEQWDFLGKLCDEFLKVSNELYEKYGSNL